MSVETKLKKIHNDSNNKSSASQKLIQKYQYLNPLKKELCCN